MADIERRLIALETRLVETSISNVSFTEENPATMPTLIERVQVSESRVNYLEPSNSTLHSSMSSTPLEPPEDQKRKEGLTNEPSSSSTQDRPIVSITQTYDGWIGGKALEKNTGHWKSVNPVWNSWTSPPTEGVGEKLNRMLQTTDLPSFGHDSSSKSLPLASLSRPESSTAPEAALRAHTVHLEISVRRVLKLATPSVFGDRLWHSSDSAKNLLTSTESRTRREELEASHVYQGCRLGWPFHLQMSVATIRMVRSTLLEDPLRAALRVISPLSALRWSKMIFSRFAQSRNSFSEKKHALDHFFWSSWIRTSFGNPFHPQGVPRTRLGRKNVQIIYFLRERHEVLTA